ncbi:SAM-dependent methyltransferase [Bosea psychrotolerans]|uniref:tRNA-Thr(GGU) m(6)t(6)A37 methyltransferase TsaA n=1 Tax=Bosea psychrotolerans TaxID=1871628 RepID=A0A2S4MBB2_9HYPH|nr:SAM-dependent methyltransferase [Bosea psychrotolerans]POR52023.1 tRNA-Thr(GGU) m(6)t(6)A37 methyltransferase TsaA [Bosea psychrotolerans]
MDWQATRPGETSAPLPERQDAHLVFIGRIATPFVTRDQCPRQGDSENGPECRVEIDAPWHAALMGIAAFTHLDLLYWMHQARRDLVTQTPRGAEPLGTFALRSPVRPNPIALSRARLLRVEEGALIVRGLDCLDGTPLLDVKPNRCAQSPSQEHRHGAS